jgi:hypothetical protein
MLMPPVQPRLPGGGVRAAALTAAKATGYGPPAGAGSQQQHGHGRQPTGATAANAHQPYPLGWRGDDETVTANRGPVQAAGA